jgi:hypothetical protein
MGIECAYSFNDLHLAANGKGLSAQESESFLLLDQNERNALVKQWAELAGWLVEDRVGSDGLVYTAFWPRQDN